jgi:hypothetical protein
MDMALGVWMLTKEPVKTVWNFIVNLYRYYCSEIEGALCPLFFILWKVSIF